jgi:hypothetical protein
MNELEKIKIAFSNLRKLGYKANARIKCSNEKLREMTNTKKYVIFNENRWKAATKNGTLYLLWDGDFNTIINELENQGLNVNIDGTIQIHLYND